MSKRRLGVNIDHVATIRNARGENYPDPLRAALLSQKSGADSITIHLREDRRHIKDYDLKMIKRRLKIPLNLEMAPTKEMLKVALKYKPNYVCIVPEKRAELTTEGGLNLKKKGKYIKKIIYTLKKANISVTLFIEPKISDIVEAKYIGADSIELHTGKFCNLLNNGKRISTEYSNIKRSANYAKNIGLGVHAGHGLSYKSAYQISKIKDITEFNIGHFIISDAVFISLPRSIKKFKKIINN